MKILQLGPIPREQGGRGETGGVATHTWELSNQLAEQGHDVTLFAENYFGKDKQTKSNLRLCGISPLTGLIRLFYLLKFPNLIVQAFLLYYRLGPVAVGKGIVYLSQIIPIIKRSKPDIVHAHHLRYRFAMADLVANGQTELVATTHSIHKITHADGDTIDASKSIIRDCYDRCDNLIFVSEDLKDSYEGLFGPFKGNSQVIYNGVKLGEPVSNTDTESSTSSVLFVGEFSERKGVWTLISAAKHFDHLEDEIEILLVGSEESAEVKSEIESEEVASIVRIVGRVDDIDKYYAKADVLAAPSQKESFGLTVVEAMGHGTPVVGTTGIPESVLPGSPVGYRIQSDDPVRLAETILDALETDWDEQVIKEFAQRFEWDSMIKEYEEFYRYTLL